MAGMSGWKFYPLADFIQEGVLYKPGRKPVIAAFLTPLAAKHIAKAGKR